MFLIDFEMQAIQVFPLDKTFPRSVFYEFPGKRNSEIAATVPDKFAFRKFPMQYGDYLSAFTLIQKEIHAGNTFLTNLTFPTIIETSLSLREIFLYGRAKYKLLVDNQFLCFSPETFVRISDDIISTYPMKGTISSAIKDPDGKILADIKEMAEHCTVVDLLRNDLSQVAHDVKVDRFRYIERVGTNEGELLQVSSEITGKLPKGYRTGLVKSYFHFYLQVR